MKEILFATTNEAKINQLKAALLPIGIAVKGVKNKESLPQVDEDGQTAPENARKKALSYAKALKETVLSMDNALYFNGLSKDRQPGVHVRRINPDDKNERAGDETLINYYSALVKSFGGKMTGYWEFAICLATKDGQFKETKIISPRVFTGEPSAKITPGYPLESIQIDPETNKHISEMNQEEQDLFWQKAIGKPIQDFIKKIDF